MRHLILIIALIAFNSCSDTPDIDTPSTYLADGIEILQVKAYRYADGQYEEISIDEAGEPNTTGMTGGTDILELLDKSELSFDDGFGTEVIPYEINSGSITFVSNGSSYSMEISDDGNSLRSKIVGGGSFDDLNPHPIASATCIDENCDDVDPSGYIYSSTDGTIGYVIIYNEVFSKL